MWIELFSIVGAIAVGLAVAAVIVQAPPVVIPPKRKPGRVRASVVW